MVDALGAGAVLSGAVVTAAAVYAASPVGRRREPMAAPGRPAVGLFVHTWHDVNSARRVIAETRSFDTPGWYWWGRPAFAGGDMAKYTWKNPAMVDYHIDNWIALGVDFVFLDFTNGNQPQILEGARALCRRLQQRGGEGPKVVFWIQKPEFAALYRQQFYDVYPDIMFRWKGKPLLLLKGAAGAKAPPQGLDYFTTRWCWGLLGPASGSMWTFKETGLPNPYIHNGVKEQIGVTLATQETYMTTPQGRKCRDGGKFFERQAEHARAHNPEIITICGYNEWMAINTGTKTAPVFVDLLNPECSHDIEPMKGGHGDMYFKMVQRFVRSLEADVTP